MKACPACHGDGGFDFTDIDNRMALLAQLVGVAFVPGGVVQCDVCEGVGTVTDERHRDLEGWAVARVDQFLAAEAAGEFA